MAEHYHVRLEKEYLVFSAAHFITYGDDECERLHGHNYRVLAEVHGPLDANKLVVDFILLRDVLAEIIKELDHRVLLPTDHPTIRIKADEVSVEATFRDRRWLFPRGDCVLLPVANTSAEMLARHIGRRLLDTLEARGAGRPRRVRVGVDECLGQWGICELENE